MCSSDLRNILDACIDPYMNIFTRDNTNDGGGWDIRFSHVIQTAEYGYPSWYKNFPEEIMPALADYHIARPAEPHLRHSVLPGRTVGMPPHVVATGRRPRNSMAGPAPRVSSQVSFLGSTLR